MRTSRRVLVLVFGVAGLVACSDARQPAKAPEPTATPAAAPAGASVDDRTKSEGPPPIAGGIGSADPAADLAAIARAEAQINAIAAAGGEKKKEEAPAKGGGASAPRAQAETGAASSCPSACSALGSMTRATDHLCSLTGEVDPRCTDARLRTKSAEAKVKGSCTC